MAMFAAIPQSFASDLAGQASVIDDESLEIHRTRIGYGESMRPRPIGFARPKGLTSLQILHFDMGDQITDMPLQIGAAVANVTTPAQASRSVLWRCGRARPSKAEGSARRTRHARRRERERKNGAQHSWYSLP
jgi:hypothetical protein